MFIPTSDDLDASAVLGDQLQEARDPLGALIALDLRGSAPNDKERAAALGPAADLAGAITWQHGVPFRASGSPYLSDRVKKSLAWQFGRAPEP